MNEKELLTAARREYPRDVGKDWNPLRRDGDAFRLAVHLGMNVTPYQIHGPRLYTSAVVISCDGGRVVMVPTEHLTEGELRNPAAATRMAIVLCAAGEGVKL